MARALAQGDVDRVIKRYGGPDIEWVEGHPTPEPGSLDLVVLDHVIQLLAHPQVGAALDMYAALLRPGGQMIVIVPSLEWAAEQYIRHDDPSVAAFVSLYGTPELPHRCGFSLLQLRAVVCRRPGLGLVAATAEWYEANINGRAERVLQNVLTVVKRN